MEVKKIRPTSKAIQERFFQALNKCIEKKKIESLASFCRDHDLNRPRYVKLRKITLNPEVIPEGKNYKFIDIDALNYLVKDGDVSAEWLLTGRGEVFKK
jgi:hypothetical protein